MEKEILEKYIKAGHIAAQVREESSSVVKVDSKLLDAAEWIENRIRELGGLPAFPVNISVNNVAAHYTPSRNDDSVFRENDMVKVDIGVHVDGYIGDTATTIVLGEKNEDAALSKAGRDALDSALKIIKPGTKISEIGEVIENAIKSAGFKPISNLTGHGLEQYDLHAEPQIPNIKTGSDYELSQDQVIAIEPFASNGSGFVKESGEVLICMLLSSVPARMPESRQIMNFGQKTGGLPFAKRWLDIPDIKFRLAMRELKMRNAIHEYPVLKDDEGCKISQFEHTVIVSEKPVVTTLA